MSDSRLTCSNFLKYLHYAIYYFFTTAKSKWGTADDDDDYEWWMMNDNVWGGRMNSESEWKRESEEWCSMYLYHFFPNNLSILYITRYIEMEIRLLNDDDAGLKSSLRPDTGVLSFGWVW